MEEQDEKERINGYEREGGGKTAMHAIEPLDQTGNDRAATWLDVTCSTHLMDSQLLEVGEELQVLLPDPGDPVALERERGQQPELAQEVQRQRQQVVVVQVPGIEWGEGKRKE